MRKTFLFVLTIAFALASCKSSKHADLGDGIFADIQTSKGEIVVKLEHDKTPVTVANFVSLAEGKSPFVSENLKGKKYFDGLIFHRVMKDFMIQGGDPTGTGTGSPGYKFKDEFNDSLKHDKAGILSMANPGPPNTNGSQFFITHAPTPWLDNRHTIFGEVLKGMDVVDSIANVATAQAPQKDKPVVDVVMNTVEIIRNGKEAKKFDAVQIMTDYFAEEEVRAAQAEKEKQERQEALEKMLPEFVKELADTKKKAKTLPSGLQILSLAEGTERPKIGQQVNVLYAGYLEDGTLFDSNIEEIAIKFNAFDERRKQGRGYEPTPMLYSPEARLFPGFKEGLLTMKVGDKVRLFMPPHLGLGEQGGGPIPPNSNLIFDVEITGIAQ